MKFSFLCLFLIGFFSINAQENNWSFNLIHYSTQDGLPSNETYKIFQDSNEYIWVATDRGVSRFNGSTFKNYTKKDGLVDNTVFGFYEDTESRIWIRSFLGKLCYFENDSIHQYAFNDSLIKHVTTGIISGIFLENDTMYVGVSSGKKSGMFKISPKGKLSNELQYNDTTVKPWYIIDNGAYLLYGNFINKTFPKGTTVINIYNEKKTSIPIKSYASKIKVIKWCEHEYIVSLEKTILIIKNDSISNQLKFNQQILSLYKDKENKLWVGTNDGIYYYKNGIENKPLHVLPEISVSSVLEDQEGSIWISTLNDGIYRIASKEVLILPNINTSKKININSISHDQNNSIWTTYSNGTIEKITLDKRQLFPLSDEVKEAYNIYHFGVDSMIISSGHSDQHFLINGVNKSVSIGVYGLKNIIYLADEKYFVGCCPTGILMFNLDSLLYKSAVNGFGERINDLCIDSKNTIWLAGFSSLWSYDGENYTNHGLENDLLEQRINQIKVDNDNHLYMALSSNGILIKNGKDVHHIGEKEGLLSDMCTSIYLHKNELWIGTNKGLNRLTVNSWSPFEYQIDSYDEFMGLPHGDIRSITYLNNHVWLAYHNKIAVFNEQKVKSNSVAPKLYLKSILVNNEPTSTDDLNNLSYTNNNLSFDFESIGYKNLGETNIQYRLTSNSLQWKKATEGFIQLPSLSSGDYQLEVRSINEAGIESDSFEINFLILPPWWETWWFKLSFLGIVGLIVWGIFKWRIAVVRAKNRAERKIAELEKSALQAQMNPHFIFNSLNSIQKFISESDKQNAEIFLAKFASLIRLILESSRAPSFPLEKEKMLLEYYLELEQNRFKNKFNFSIKIDDQIDLFDAYVPPMIVQPFIENAILHGMLHKEGKGNITIEFNHESNNSIKCIVDDDGIGRKKAATFKVNSAHQSVGILIAKERLSILSGSIDNEINIKIIDKVTDDNVSLGTRVEILIPLLDD